MSFYLYKQQVTSIRSVEALVGKTTLHRAPIFTRRRVTISLAISRQQRGDRDKNSIMNEAAHSCNLVRVCTYRSMRVHYTPRERNPRESRVSWKKKTTYQPTVILFSRSRRMFPKKHARKSRLNVNGGACRFKTAHVARNLIKHIAFPVTYKAIK